MTTRDVGFCKIKACSLSVGTFSAEVMGGAVIGFVVGYGIFRTIGEKRNRSEQSKSSAANEA